ncbi:MAG: hypothetical protein AAF393_06060 [Pseudomonadota bacterium]
MAWLAVMALFVISGVLKGAIRSKGLLGRTGSSRPDPERVVLLFATFGVALHYTITSMTLTNDQLRMDGKSPSMPDVPVEILLLLFGAQSSFVVGKILRRYLGGILK